MKNKEENLEINSYEEFYKSFNNSQKQVKSNLILYLQNYIYSKVINQKDNDFNIGTDELYLNKDEKKDNTIDAITFMIDETLEACKHIKNNMNEKIIREHVMVPAYKVREVDSYSLQWLSRQPGQTIKQKIGSKNSMMAVKRRMSFDTAENQLFCSYINQLSYLLEDKTTYLESFYKDNERKHIKKEEEVFNLANSLRYDEEFKEIKRWGNLPPNNTLLTNKYYKKVYKSWNDLKDLDDLISDYYNSLERYLLIFIKIELLIRLKKYFYMPQFFVDIDPRYYDINILSGGVVGLDIHSNVLEFNFDNDNISINYKNKKINLSISNNKLYIKVNENEIKLYILSAKLDSYITRIIDIIDAPKLKNEIKEYKKQGNFNKIYVDLFSSHPRFIDENSNVNEISKRLVMQDIQVDKNEFKMSCSKSNAIYLGKYKGNKINTYSFNSFKINRNDKQLRNMFSMLKRYINTNEITFLFPDSMDIFELSKIHKTCRLEYKKVKSFPNSISSIFKYQESDEFKKNFNESDVVVVIDIISNRLSLTAIKGHYDENRFKEDSKYKGIIWERYPTTSINIKDLIDNLMNNLEKLGCKNPQQLYEVFSIEGIKNELDLMIMYDNQEIFKISREVKKLLNDFKINVDDKISEFLIDDMKIKDLSKIHIISLSDMINIEVFENNSYMTKNDILEGINEFNKLKEKTEMILWKDHLPDLSIKMLCTKFDLVKNITVLPSFNKEQQIEIKETFILPKHKKVQRFKLSQNQLSENKQYEAVIKSSRFPLKEDVECKLNMIYRYGEEQPYELKFIPIDIKKAGFKEAKVEWIAATFDDYMDIDYPRFPKIKSWEEFKNEAKERKTESEEFKNNAENKSDILYVEKTFKDMLSLNKEKEIFQFNIKNYDFTTPRKRILIKHSLDGKDIVISLRVDERLLKETSKIDFEIIEDKTNNERYSVDLKEINGYWKQNQYGYVLSSTLLIDGEYKKVLFYSDNFIDDYNFDEGYENKNEDYLYFSLQYIKGKDLYRASKITTKPKDFYKSKNVRKANEQNRGLSKSLYHMHTLFFGGKSVVDYECPEEIRSIFVNSTNELIYKYNHAVNKSNKKAYFRMLCLIATDIGDSFYKILYEMIDDSITNNKELDETSIGYALGKYDKEYQKILLEKILKLKGHKIIVLLSKAMWKNPEFIFNVEKELIVNLFNKSILQLEKECKKLKKELKKLDEGSTNDFKRRRIIKEIGELLEFILGVMRLRECKNKDISYELSLNNPNVQKLHNLIYYLIEEKIQIETRIKLKVDKKGIWKDFEICDILFALPIYITGDNGESDIKIESVEQ